MTKRKQKQLKRQNKKLKRKQAKSAPKTNELVINEGSENMACMVALFEACDLKEESRDVLNKVAGLPQKKEKKLMHPDTADRMVREVIKANPLRYSSTYKSSRDTLIDSVKSMRNAQYDLSCGKDVGVMSGAFVRDSPSKDIQEELSIYISMLNTLEDKTVRHFVSTSKSPVVPSLDQAIYVSEKSGFVNESFVFELCTNTSKNKFIALSFTHDDSRLYALFNYRHEVGKYQLMGLFDKDGEDSIKLNPYSENMILSFFAVNEDLTYEIMLYDGVNSQPQNVAYSFAACSVLFIFKVLEKVSSLEIKQASARSSKTEHAKPSTDIEVCTYTKLDDFTTSIVTRKGIGKGVSHASPKEHVRKAHERKYRDASGNVVKVVEIGQTTINKGYVK